MSDDFGGPGFEEPGSDLADLFAEVGEWFSYWPVVVLAALLTLALLLLPTMIYQIDRDERGVLLRFGQFSRQISPGLGWKLPYPLERLHVINTQRMNRHSFGHRTEDGVPGDVLEAERLLLSGDLGVARIEWDVLYRRTDPVLYVFNVQDEELLIRQASQSALRQVVGDYDVVDAITAARREIARKTRSKLQDLLDNYNSGITVSEVNIQQSEPPGPVVSAFHRVNSARQIREEKRHQAEEKWEEAIPPARGRRQQMIAEARGDSIARINLASGQATRFEEMLEEYQLAPEVTRERMYLETMEAVIKESDDVRVIDSQIPGLLPHLNLGGED